MVSPTVKAPGGHIRTSRRPVSGSRSRRNCPTPSTMLAPPDSTAVRIASGLVGRKFVGADALALDDDHAGPLRLAPRHFGQRVQHVGQARRLIEPAHAVDDSAQHLLGLGRRGQGLLELGQRGQGPLGLRLHLADPLREHAFGLVAGRRERRRQRPLRLGPDAGSLVAHRPLTVRVGVLSGLVERRRQRPLRLGPDAGSLVAHRSLAICVGMLPGLVERRRPLARRRRQQFADEPADLGLGLLPDSLQQLLARPLHRVLENHRRLRLYAGSAGPGRARRPTAAERRRATRATPIRGIIRRLPGGLAGPAHSDEGGDTASTGIGEHGMHAEHHRLVNPMENTITANDTQLALAA